MTTTTGIEVGLQLAIGAAADVRAISGGVAVCAAEGERARAIVDAMRERLVDGQIDELASAWQAGALAGVSSASAVLITVRGNSIVIVHAGDLAVYAIGPRGVRALTSPHVRFDERFAQRVRTRAIGLPGHSGQSELTEVARDGATRLAIATSSVWAPLGTRFADGLATTLSATELAAKLCEVAAAQTPGVAATRRVPRACAIIELPSSDLDVLPPAVPVAAQQVARRAIRGVLARMIGARGVVLVGPRGVGKTTVIEQLGRTGMIDANAIVVASSQLRRELKAPTPSLAGIIVVDRVLDALGDAAAGNVLAELIDARRIALVTTASPEDLAALASGHKRLAEKLATVTLAPPTPEEVEAIVGAWAPRFASRRGVRLEADVVAAAAELTHSFALGRSQPEAALFALEQACLRAGHAGVVTGSTNGRGAGVVDRRAVSAAIADQRGVALDVIERAPDLRANELAPWLSARLHGQSAAVDKVANAIVRGIDRGGDRPIASLLLLGPTGTGKTETARLLAEYWYSDRRALTTIDLSEYREPASAFRLIGAPPGYVGHGARPPLALALAANPHQVVLFDELEKACSEVQLLLLQILDQGMLTTSQGEVVRFRDAVVVLTSNLEIDSTSVGFVRRTSEQTDREQLARHLRPELVARIDEVVEYSPLDAPAATTIALAYLARTADALVAANRLRSDALPALRQSVLRAVAQVDRSGGARGVLRAVERVLAEDRAPRASVPGLAIVYPYLEGGRERLAAGFAVTVDTQDITTLLDAILVHPSGGSLLYVAHDPRRIIALCGNEEAALEIARSLGRDVVTATGRVRADISGRPIGELVDRLLAR